MGCYWLKTEEGVVAHVNGSLDASPESKKAIEAVINAAYKEFVKEDEQPTTRP